jgi:hypothetical protein
LSNEKFGAMAVLGHVIEEIVLHMAHAAKYPERCRSLLSSIIVGDKRRAYGHIVEL